MGCEGMTAAEGYSKETLRDLTVNRWRYALIAVAIVAVVLFAMYGPARDERPSFSYMTTLLLLPLVYLLFTVWAAAGYAIAKRPDGGLPRANGNLVMAIIILFVPRELLK